MQPITLNVEEAFDPRSNPICDKPPTYAEAINTSQSIPSVPKDRSFFIRDVCRMVGIELAFAVVCIVLININHDWGLQAAIMLWPLYLSFALFYIVYFTLLYSPNIRQKMPWKYVVLVALTVFLSMWAMIESAVTRSTGTPYIMLVVWALLFAGLVFAARKVSYDLTRLYLHVYKVMLLWFILNMVWEVWIWLYVIMSAVGAVLFAVLLLIHIQAVFGGKTFEYPDNELMLASAQVFVCGIFIYLELKRIVSRI